MKGDGCHIVRTLGYGWGVSALVVAVDQLVKMWVIGIMEGGGRVIEVLPFLNVVMVWNRGMSFGWLSQAGDIAPLFFLGIAGVFSMVLAVWMMRATTLMSRVSLALILGGAVGNAIDRIRWGAVADFIDVYAFGWHFWTFNTADIAITVGVVVWVADALLYGENKA